MDPRTEKMLADRRQQPAAGGPAGGHSLSLTSIKTSSRARWALAAVVGVILIAAIAGGRYAFVARAAEAREAAALEQQRARQAMEARLDTNQASLDACLAAIEAERIALWDAACRDRRQRKGCGLLRDVAEQHQRADTDKRADCLKRFSLGTAQP